jgi:hypothetical protein
MMLHDPQLGQIKAPVRVLTIIYRSLAGCGPQRAGDISNPVTDSGKRTDLSGISWMVPPCDKISPSLWDQCGAEFNAG